MDPHLFKYTYIYTHTYMHTYIHTSKHKAFSCASSQQDCQVDGPTKMCMGFSPKDVLYSGWVGDDDATFQGSASYVCIVLYVCAYYLTPVTCILCTNTECVYVRCMYVCIFMSICMNVCIFIRICMYVCMAAAAADVYMYVCTYVHMRVRYLKH